MWLPGMLEEKDLYNMFPFDNILQSFNISGSSLKQMLQIIQSGTKGFYQFWGIESTVHIEGDKKQFRSARMMNGS